MYVYWRYSSTSGVSYISTYIARTNLHMLAAYNQYIDDYNTVEVGRCMLWSGYTYIRTYLRLHIMASGYSVQSLIFEKINFSMHIQS